MQLILLALLKIIDRKSTVFCLSITQGPFTQKVGTNFVSDTADGQGRKLA